MMMNFTADAKILIPVCPELMGPTCRMPMGGVAVVRAGVAGRAGGVRRAAISGCIHCRSCDCKIGECKIGAGHTRIIWPGDPELYGEIKSLFVRSFPSNITSRWLPSPGRDGKVFESKKW